MIVGISDLPNVYFVDVAQKLNKLVPQDAKNQMDNQGLDAYLQHYNLASKLDHDYEDLQKRLSTAGSDISDIINYC